jgi:undecaprenyl-diphosphatase
MLSRPDCLGWRALVRREREIVILAVMAAACLLLFRQIAVVVEQGRANAFDLNVLHVLRRPGLSHPESILWIYANIGASDLSAMGSNSVLAYIVVLVSGLFLGLKRWREAGLLFFASAGGLAMTIGFQALFNRPRPPMTAAEAAGLNASFPSGHALLSATVYLTLGTLIGHFAERRFVRAYALGAAAVLTVIVGVSRVFLGMHWCTDVLAGWCIGLGWALAWRAIALVWERLSRRRLRTGLDTCDEEASVPQGASGLSTPSRNSALAGK